MFLGLLKEKRKKKFMNDISLSINHLSIIYSVIYRPNKWCDSIQICNVGTFWTYFEMFKKT